ncbi:MAG: PD-(D/E)XK nuclease family transposase [Thiomargarita sp.]|nr:PD-(D/E)XK nuclease family transposase [Thiomargarita sp.]
MKVIPLKYGSMFKHAFGQPDIFCQFVKDILDIDIIVDKVHTEYEYPKPIGFVRSIYDLFAEDKEKRIIVEIQHVKSEDFFDRFLYYHLISMVEQVGGYKEYCFDRTVYTIVVLTSTPRDGTINFSGAISDMNPVSIDDGEIIDIYPHRLIFLCPRKVNEKTPQRIKKWLHFIEDSLDGEMNEKEYQHSPWKKILDTIRKYSTDPKVLSEIKDEAAWDKAKERFAKEGREDGMVAGMKKGMVAGIAKGKKTGITEGKKAGIAEGLQQGQLKIAQALLDVLDDKTIAQKTKLTIARIRKLRKEV